MNSYNYSYNVLINRLEAFAAGHLLIKRFTHGQIDLADMDQNEQYPFMHVVPNNIKPVEGGMQFDFQILFADIPRDKETKAEYQREVISDCVRLAQDLIAEVKNGLILFGFDVQLVTPPVIEPFVEEYKNTLTGVSFSLQLEVPWDWSACDIPAVWSVGGTSSGGTGNAYGITLKTNGVNNAVQNILDLVAGTNVTITDNGDGSVTFDASGEGGPSVLVSTEFNVNHTTATGNQYVVGDRVWYQGNVYACIAANDAILPTNAAYWTLQGAGFRLRQTPVDWNASSGDYQILNKPTIPAAQVNSDWNAVSGVAEILNKPTIPAAQVNSDWNAVSGVAQILNKPTIPTTLDSLTDVNTPAPTNGQVLTYNTSTGEWIASTPSTPTPTGYYGAFQDDTTQTAVSANTAYPVKFNTTDLSNGVTVVNDGSGNPTRVTLANTGIYNVQFSLQLEKTGGSGNFIIDIWLRKNGVDIPDTSGKVVLTGSANASPIVAAWNYLLDLAGGDYVQLMWSTTNNNAVIFAAVATPPHPGVPSSILTVTQQAGILAGTGITAINSLTGAVQTIGTGTTGTDFAVVSSGTSHTFNLPTASAANRGALSSADWSTFNGKQNSIGLTTVGTNLATLPNPSAVRYLRINADNTISALTIAQLKTDLSAVTDITLVVPTNLVNVGTTYEDIPALSFPVTANKTYKWRATISWTATAQYFASTNGPANSFTTARFTLATGATTNGVTNQTTYDATGTNVFGTSSGLITADGIFRVTASGTWALRFRCQTAGAMTIRAGSVLEYQEVL
jgi:hypothetical protein